MDNLTPITREEILMNDEPLTPITREEKILAGEDLNPVTRREYFLKKYRHAGGDVMVEGLEVTANGTYTAPEGKAYSPVEVAVPLPENAYLLKNASGSLVSFSDGTDLPIPSFVCNIEAVQDLHGYDAPWVGGAGKNILPITSNNETINGVTFTVNKDSAGNVVSVTANGTATNTTIYSLGMYTLEANTYIMNGCPTDGSRTTFYMDWRKDDGSQLLDEGEGSTYTSNGQTDNYARIIIVNGTTCNNLVFYPMIRLATETDPTFAPYENICPISGHTGLNAWLRGKNLANPATVTTLYPTGDSGTYQNQIRNSSNARSVIAEVTPNTTYTISKKAGQRFRLAFTAEVPAIGVADYAYNSNDTGTTITVTSPSNAKYMVVLFWNANEDTDTMETMLATVQIEIGETASTYEPYNSQSQTIQVSWQTEAGEVYGGYVDLVSGILIVDRIYKIFTNTDSITWYKYGNYNRFYAAWPKVGKPNTATTSADGVICSKYKVVSKMLTNTQNGEVIVNTSNISQAYDNIAIYDDRFETPEAFKASLSTPLQVLYPLGAPQTYQLTPTQIKSLLGNNNAWCDTGDVDIDYFAKEVTG